MRQNPPARTPDEVQSLHPVSATGCSQRRNGVQPSRERGAVVAPEPSFEPSGEPSAVCAGARGSPGPEDHRPGATAALASFHPARARLAANRASAAAPCTNGRCGAGDRMGSVRSAGLRRREYGWPSEPIRGPGGQAVVGGTTRTACPEPCTAPWCGACDEVTLRGFDGDAPGPCPDCHPLAARRDPDTSAGDFSHKRPLRKQLIRRCRRSLRH
jgi:hypothetical protein